MVPAQNIPPAAPRRTREAPGGGAEEEVGGRGRSRSGACALRAVTAPPAALPPYGACAGAAGGRGHPPRGATCGGRGRREAAFVRGWPPSCAEALIGLRRAAAEPISGGAQPGERGPGEREQPRWRPQRPGRGRAGAGGRGRRRGTGTAPGQEGARGGRGGPGGTEEYREVPGGTRGQRGGGCGGHREVLGGWRGRSGAGPGHGPVPAVPPSCPALLPP